MTGTPVLYELDAVDATGVTYTRGPFIYDGSAYFERIMYARPSGMWYLGDRAGFGGFFGAPGAPSGCPTNLARDGRILQK